MSASSITSQVLRKGNAPVDLSDTELLQFSLEPEGSFVEVQVDLLVAKSDYAREAIARSVELGQDALGFAIRVLACEDLIIFKLLAGRIIDRADATLASLLPPPSSVFLRQSSVFLPSPCPPCIRGGFL